ncbi:MAG: IS5/IS1182 family transposase, partial [Treponema sp.]|nr:IS5/IS1182 family transposase [Treponema sp.]
MASILRREWDKLHEPGGRPSKLTVREKLTVTLKRLGECRAMESICADCGVGKSTACETIQWVEGTLKKDNAFQSPGKKALRQDDSPVRYVAVDVTESPIQRPKRMAFREKEAPYG